MSAQAYLGARTNTGFGDVMIDGVYPTVGVAGAGALSLEAVQHLGAGGSAFFGADRTRHQGSGGQERGPLRRGQPRRDGSGRWGERFLAQCP